MNKVTFLRLQQLQRQLGGRSRSACYDDIAKGLLPPPVHLSERYAVWPEHEINAVASARLAGRPADEIRALVAELVEARSKAA